jgi:diguanylate cyclase (GGDEF)-like protein
MLVNTSLRWVLTASAIVLAVATTAGLAAITENLASNQLKQQLGFRMASRTVHLNDKIDHSIYARYTDMSDLSGVITDLDLADDISLLRTRLDATRKTNGGFAWIGFSDPHGKVLAATNGLLEAADVAQRPWFREASKSVYFGDVHRALLLEKKLNSDGGEPLRFLDIALPLVDKNGVLTGVLGAHIDWRWIEELTRSLYHKGPSEFILLGADDTVLAGPKDLRDRVVSLQSARNARSGKVGYGIEQWPDGKTYLTGFSKSRGFKNYVGLGWVMLERQEIGEAFAPVRGLRGQFLTWGLFTAAVFALTGWFGASRIARPLLELTRAAEVLRQGTARRDIPAVRSYYEVVVLTDTMRSMIAEVAHREALLEHQATYNSVTNLPNRALTNALLIQSASRIQKGQEIAVLSIDLDRFKSVNDALGFSAGNDLLREAVRRLQYCVPAGATLAHLGSDEFAVLLDGDRAHAQATKLAARAQAAIAQPFVVEGQEFFLSASVGISLFPRDTADVSMLLGYSEMARYQAKALSHGRIQFYAEHMNALTAERLNLERDMRTALAEQQFELFYQPKVSLRTGEITGAEALVRWRHPQHGLVSPAKFIPLAEDTGLILPLGDWVLRQACAQARTWRARGAPPLQIAVNVSSHQFMEDKLVEKVVAALADSGLEAEHLKLEITESLLMQDVEQNIGTMHALTGLGVQLAIDDFGTGYSSLSYLRRFPISELKIDQAFVRDLNRNAEDTAITHTIISLARNLGLNVIAEGVETIEQATSLRAAGCDEMQGYYFSRPIAADALCDLLLAHGQEAQAGLLEAMQPVV